MVREETLRREPIVVLTPAEETELQELLLDRLSVLAEAAHDLGMVEEYALIEEAAEGLARRLEARQAA